MSALRFPPGSQAEVRLSVYSDSAQFAGAEISLANLIAALSSAIRVTVVGVDDDIVNRLVSVRPDTEGIVVRPVRERKDLGGLRSLRRALTATRPQIVQVNLPNPWSCRYALLAALTIRGARVVAIEHLPTPPPARRLRVLKRLTSSRLAAHVAVGEEVAHAVEGMTGLRAGTVRVIHNGVPDVALSVMPRPRDGLVVGSLARLHPDKRLDRLVSAIARIPGVNLVLVGDGTERASLERLAEDLGIADRVCFVGWTPRARDYLTAFDVFALTSRSEGFPLSTIEAMLAGLPVVVTTVGDAGVAVVDGETGFSVPPDDLSALVAALQRLLEAPSLRASMGAAGRARALARYTDTSMARAYEDLYASVLGIEASTLDQGGRVA